MRPSNLILVMQLYYLIGVCVMSTNCMYPRELVSIEDINGEVWQVLMISKIYWVNKKGHKRIHVATDLVGRGIDIERVNIVTMTCQTADTYLHRALCLSGNAAIAC
ncbi:hypothetical protein MKW98_010606 [Papaver atlanticum]|uniref:Helicase C-terminal domain-containing protein n=1 Tax=Papaver atlanticum TaxID=357466 RepID=A0AAD4X6R7_9MAGN|nr:hypothetical protein MKW98_010606 [Papaver atlanticum]